MLEVKILKVTHVGRDEARKLLVHIGNCDVYSPEIAATAKKDAEYFEDAWEKAVSQKMNRTQFQKWLNEEIKKNMNTLEEIKDYLTTEYEYIYRAGLPIFCLERHTEENSIKIRELNQSSTRLSGETVEYLIKKQIDQYLEKKWEHLKVIKDSREIRDREIANNIENAESYLVKRYPFLKQKETIKLTAGLGHSHSPEKYTSLSIKTEILSNGKDKPSDRLIHAIKQQTSFDSCAHYMLAHGAHLLIDAGSLKITREEVGNMSRDELYNLLSK